MDGFNVGDVSIVDRVWALPEVPDTLHWYSVTESMNADPSAGGATNVVLNTNAELRAYIEGRAAAHEQLGLVMADVGTPGADTVGTSFVIRRSADDLHSTLGGLDHLAWGKAAIDCATQQFVVMSVAQTAEPPDGLPPYWPCPRPSGWRLHPPIVCSR